MARQKGVVRFTGTIDGLTYYESKYGPLVRKKGGPTKEQFRTDPAFKRSRENAKEFGNCNEAVKTLRAIMMPMMKHARDFQVTSRLMKLMAAIKNLDNISVRGERDVAVGILSPAAKDLMVGFDFNDMAKLGKVLGMQCTVDTSSGVVSIFGLIPNEYLNYTAAATHASFTGGWARIDFGTGSGELMRSNQLTLPLDGLLNNVVLTPIASPSGTGTDIFVLQIAFFQEVNGVLYKLGNGEHNTMGVVGIA